MRRPQKLRLHRIRYAEFLATAVLAVEYSCHEHAGIADDEPTGFHDELQAGRLDERKHRTGEAGEIGRLLGVVSHPESAADIQIAQRVDAVVSQLARDDR